MPMPPTPLSVLEENWAVYQKHGGDRMALGKAAKELNLNTTTLWSRIRKYKDIQEADPAVLEGMKALGATMVPNLAWIKTDPNGKTSYSFQMKAAQDEGIDLQKLVGEAISEAVAEHPRTAPPREPITGECLLVVDLADVHFLKLCVEAETGYRYDREVARHRVVEGTRALLRMSDGFKIGRVLFVLGNDILHTDSAKPETTSGTPQDTDGTIYEGWKDAFSALSEAIDLCAQTAEVDLIHCMSNHDKLTGWALSQSIAQHFKDDPRVHSSDYSMSERNRKYYRFGNNLLSLDHGDGVKEEKMIALMVQEARPHVSECQHLYAYRHHFHSKTRKRRGIDVFESEKDHTGLTAIHTGATWSDGAQLSIEYVRSPSPPDGWHDLYGYVNRQGVECFVHHPNEGQKARFTEWF